MRDSAPSKVYSHRITSSEQWDDATVRINVTVDTEDAQEVARANLERIIGASRTKAEPNIIVRDPNKQTIFELIRDTSRDTDLVLMGFREPHEDEDGEFIK